MSELKQRAHVLIVDDEESIRSALRRVLRREYQLSFASSAADALELLRTERPDMIISDHLMPEMTGLELLKRCRLLYPHMGRVVLTGQAEMTMVISAINEGSVFRFLTKPWDDDELKLTVHLAIEHARESRREGTSREEASREGLSQGHVSPSDISGNAPQAQASMSADQSALQDLETAHPGLTALTRDKDGAIMISTDEDV